jgi:cell division inhibitor SulA
MSHWQRPSRFIPSGISSLDAILPSGGWPLGELVEIELSDAAMREWYYILLFLSHMTAKGQWITCIAPPRLPNARTLSEHGFEPNRLLVVHPHIEDNGFDVVEQALKNNSNGAVVAWPAIWDDESLEPIRSTAYENSSIGILLRQHSHDGKHCTLSRLHLHIDIVDDMLTVVINHRKITISLSQLRQQEITQGSTTDISTELDNNPQMYCREFKPNGINQFTSQLTLF